jgi:hypothetical protein
MIVCSCNAITSADISAALLYLLNAPEPQIPTPGLVYRHLGKKMVCCGCAPLAVETIYARMDELERKGLVCPYRAAAARERLLDIAQRNSTPRTSGRTRTAPGACACEGSCAEATMGEV